MAETITPAVVPVAVPAKPAVAVPVAATKPQRTLTASLASEWAVQTRETVIIAGNPKGAGKTTFALSATKPGQRTVVVACDLGKLSIPPMVDKSNVLVVPYQALTREISEGHSRPVKDVYLKLTGDLYEIYDSIRKDRAIRLDGGREFAPPHNVILDGVSRLNGMLVDGQCSLNNILDPSDLDNKAFKFWGKRLRDILAIVEQFASLPCNVILTAWVEEKKTPDGQGTGVYFPDVGGKMDVLAAGEMSNAIYGYSRQGKFFVRTKADGSTPWIGMRDRYTGIPAEIDVTIEGKPGEKSPWSKVFGD